MKKLKKRQGGGPGDGKPTVVSNPNDPRLKRYQDSLALYNYDQEFDRRLQVVRLHGEENNFAGNKAFLDWANKSAPYDAIRRLTDYNNQYPGHNGAFAKADDLTLDNNGKSVLVFPYGYDKPQGEVVYRKPEPPTPIRSKVQSPQQLTPSIGQITPSTDGIGSLAGGPTNFSFTGRDESGQQVSKYFSDLDTWKAATDQLGYRQRETTNNGQEAHATGYQFKKGGMTLKKKDLGGPQLANVGAKGPASIPDWASNLPGDFLGMHNAQSRMDPNIQKQEDARKVGWMEKNGQDLSNPGMQINWQHVLNSYVASGLTQGLVSSLSPNSQQNTTKEFNKQQFNPMNFLPYTANYSTQDRFGTQGMKKGGLVKKEEGGTMSEEMRKWILSEDETPPVQQEAMEQSPAADDDAAQQAAQFNMFVQMFGWDQADQEQSPEMKKGGWIKHAVNPAHKGYCSPVTKPTCTPRRKAFAMTMKKHHGFHKKELGGAIPYRQGQQLDITPEQYTQMIQQGYTFE